ncbi:MAG: hypothetical protein NZ951_02605 [Dehalococcoidia bacterium]|nr:hypothetical protein [Dehalococcoidia bacterium]MDW8119851.1 hypothetical protein [Chloroflexota bacterium]
MVGAGAIHPALTPAHSTHAPAHAILFALAGVAQAIWGMVFWRRPTLFLWNLGVLGTGALVVGDVLPALGPPHADHAHPHSHDDHPHSH